MILSKENLQNPIYSTLGIINFDKFYRLFKYDNFDDFPQHKKHVRKLILQAEDYETHWMIKLISQNSSLCEDRVIIIKIQSEPVHIEEMMMIWSALNNKMVIN